MKLITTVISVPCILMLSVMLSDPTNGYPVMQRSVDTPTYNANGILESVPAVMHYVTAETIVAHLHRDTAGGDADFRNVEWKGHDVVVQNGRLHQPPTTLDVQGFALQALPNNNKIDFKDSNDVTEKYYPLCEEFLQKLLDCSVVKAFDHNVRMAGPSSAELLANGKGATVQQPLGVVHGDYTAISAPRRLVALASASASSNDIRKDGPVLEETLVNSATMVNNSRRYAIINLWRNIDKDHPVETHPLACLDAQSVSPEEWRTLQIHYTDRVGENILSCFSESHKWFYFPNMTHNEVLVLKQWDSAGGFAQNVPEQEKGCSTCCLHSAFLEPRGMTEKTTRQSIEVRCVCIW